MRIGGVIAVSLLAVTVAGRAGAAPLPPPADMIRSAAESGEGVWRAAADPAGREVASRDLFTYALALLEAGRHLERLQRLFELAQQMQDRDPASRTYGNFRWRWSQARVEDLNAVEFCMQGGALIWLRHRDLLPRGAGRTLKEILDVAAEGCLRHRVSESYTNIALMNAENLLLLGVILERPALSTEGAARLDRVCLDIWENGVHEYCSPTYYGVDLDCLGLMEAFCPQERARQQARALLDLFWSDIALNWFTPAQKLGGARSRDYDYVRGLGMLDIWMAAAGWIDPPARWPLGAVFPALARWRPNEHFRELNGRVPRLVRQSWGPSPCHSRTQYVLPDVALSCSGATYHNMDIPLAVELPGARTLPHAYFIADGRHDPYGKKKVPEGAHEKTVHLRPFFAAAQRTADAAALVVYRPEDVPAGTETLESHLVLPRAVDGFWIGDRRVSFPEKEPVVFPVQPGEAVVLRKGTAAVGIRIAWARGVDGRPAPTALAADAQGYGTVRLTVTHQAQPTPAGAEPAAAAFWVRVAGGLAGDADFERWRHEFAAAPIEMTSAGGRLELKVPGAGGAVTVAAGPPYRQPALLEPAPSRAVLELDGDDIGRRILADVEPIRTYRKLQAEAKPIAVPAGRSVVWEAESGWVTAPMEIGKDGKASGGHFVWMPGEPGQKGGSASGSVTWKLQVAQAGDYYLWGRVLSPTPDDDSFYVRLYRAGEELLPQAEWQVGVHPGWTWAPVALGRPGRTPTPLKLPAGEVRLQLRVREDGTRIDRLFLTPKADELPAK